MDTSKENTDQAEINIPANKIVWIIGAVILLIAGWFGLKLILGTGENYRVALVDAPKEVTAGATATFTWKIDGPATTIKKTVVYMGTTSQNGEFKTDTKPESTQYNQYVKDFESGNFNVPLQFVGNIGMSTVGTYYFRVYALIKDKNYWSDEYSFMVKEPVNSVSVISAPADGIAGQIVSFTWRVDGPPATINNTSVHFGTVSTPGDLSKTTAPADTKYTEAIKDFIKGEYKIPLQFVGNIALAKPGTYYYRGHVLINGENFWTPEKTIEIKELPKPTAKE